jgi:hypothetical protein
MPLREMRSATELNLVGAAKRVAGARARTSAMAFEYIMSNDRCSELW